MDTSWFCWYCWSRLKLDRIPFPGIFEIVSEIRHLLKLGKIPFTVFLKFYLKLDTFVEI
jgi:hypothetical protein